MTKKEQAIKFMKELKIFDGFIKDYKDKDLVCFFERYAGFWDLQEPEIEAKRKEIEKKYNCVIYAATHEFLYDDEIYSFLVVTDYPEEWDGLLTKDGDSYYAFAYCWNKSCEWCSEFGDVVIQSAFGGIRRTA